MNTTTQDIIAQLPRKPVISPAEIAAAYGLATCSAVLADIKTGRLAANKVGGKYVISRAAAEEYILKNEYKPEEGTL